MRLGTTDYETTGLQDYETTDYWATDGRNWDHKTTDYKTTELKDYRTMGRGNIQRSTFNPQGTGLKSCPVKHQMQASRAKDYGTTDHGTARYQTTDRR
jgi:hypothetical protein